MKLYNDPASAILHTKNRLWSLGQRVPSKSWQSVPSPDDTWELLNESFRIVGVNPGTLQEDVRPNQPWADEHFEERVSGLPYNPPPSHTKWPFAQKDNKQFIKDEKFDHTYPERFWPKQAGVHPDSGVVHRGIRFRYGDLEDVVALLVRDPLTRQAYLPIWFPEDTGSVNEQRVPCTIGYHFIIRNGFMHMVYTIRSCDVVRHFRDDIYLAIRLLCWVLDRCNVYQEKVRVGTFTMHIVSLHCFYNERGLLNISKT